MIRLDQVQTGLLLVHDHPMLTELEPVVSDALPFAVRRQLQHNFLRGQLLSGQSFSCAPRGSMISLKISSVLMVEPIDLSLEPPSSIEEPYDRFRADPLFSAFQSVYFYFLII